MEEYKDKITKMVYESNNIELLKFVYGILKGSENEKKED